jgi:hypothetical protein
VNQEELIAYFRMRRDNINDQLSMYNVLVDYGYISDYGDGREVQFSCDLHGSGRDQRPSARYYSRSNSYYCFGCGKSRDSVALVMEKEDLSFSKACFFLEKKYNLKRINFDYSQFSVLKENVDFSLSQDHTEEEKFDFSLKLFVEANLLSKADALRLWLGLDMIQAKDFDAEKKSQLLQRLSSELEETLHGSSVPEI